MWDVESQRKHRDQNYDHIRNIERDLIVAFVKQEISKHMDAPADEIVEAFQYAIDMISKNHHHKE